MKVTIGIPVYLGQEFIQHALEAARAQSWADLEIIVADNASSDDTLSIVREHADLDPRIRVIEAQENRGAAWNFNRLVGEAKGEFFWWLPHDDVLEPRAVELCVQRLLANPEAVSCHPRTTYIDRTGWPIGLHSRPLQLTSPSPAARLGRFLIEHSRCDGVLGLHRLAALRRTGLIRGFRGGDEILYAWPSFSMYPYLPALTGARCAAHWARRNRRRPCRPHPCRRRGYRAFACRWR